MSSDIHVFARKNDEFIELLCYGRSSDLYQSLNFGAPYEHIAPLTQERIEDAINELEAAQEEDQEYDARDKATIAQVGSWNNTINEKFEAINELQRAIDERSVDMRMRATTIGILRFLLNVEADLYYGVDCGSDVTVNDIVSD